LQTIAREGLNNFFERIEEMLRGALDPNEFAAVRVPDVDLDFDLILKLNNEGSNWIVALERIATFAQRTALIAAAEANTLPEVQGAIKENPGFFGQDRKRLKAVIEKVGTRDKGKLTRAVFQVMCHSELLPTGRVYQLADMARASSELAKVALGLAAWRADKGEFPENLRELVPAYVRKLPADVFTDKPLVYKRDGKACIVYSVGPNMKDDGGRRPDPFAMPTSRQTPGTMPADEPDDITVKLE
jgi:hypothetical protein